MSEGVYALGIYDIVLTFGVFLTCDFLSPILSNQKEHKRSLTFAQRI